MKEHLVQDILYICDSCGTENYDISNIWKCQLCGKNEICQNCRIDIFNIDEGMSDEFAKYDIYTVCEKCKSIVKQLKNDRNNLLVDCINKQKPKSFKIKER